MQDRVNNGIGALEPLENWAAIDWTQVSKRVKNLRQRIYRATQEGRWNQVRSLKKLMMRSYSNLLLSMRKVTQENKGKKTAGIDGQTTVTPDERVALVHEMKDHTLWKALPARRVYIPKANGNSRPLGIPTLKNRVAQAVVKNTLEPEWEAKFEANSYGFRPGRGCHDAIEQCWTRLNANGADAWILDADIKGAFDNISHDFILTAIGNIPGRELVKQWLKAGYVEAEVFNQTQSGTPQGGIISPLLANIALDGMEEWIGNFTSYRTYQCHGKPKRKRVPTYGFIRYADDFAITARSKEDIEAIIPEVEKWLTARGLQLNKEKTRIRHIEEGFDFLGFNIRSYKGKCLIKPQREKVQAKLREIRTWLNTHQNADPSAVIQVLNPILRGWANYYKHAVSKEVFASFDHHIVQMLIRWAKRRHPTKGVKWVVSRYFGRIGGDRWVLRAKTLNRQGNPVVVYLFRLATTPITRHIKVQGRASPDDPNLKAYWKERNARYGNTHYAPDSKLHRVGTGQQWSCPECSERLFNGESIHVHHCVLVKAGGGEGEENLQLLHAECHRQIHDGRVRIKCGGLEPYDR